MTEMEKRFLHRERLAIMQCLRAENAAALEHFTAIRVKLWWYIDFERSLRSRSPRAG